MTWENFYLTCFLIGFALTAVSLLGGIFHFHLPGKIHIHVGHGGHGHAGLSPFNLPTIMAFLAWFGGAGFLLVRHSTLEVVVALGLSLLSGLIGGGIVFLFFAKFLLAREQELNPADYEMTGVLGRISAPVRKGGIGEMIFSQQGGRRAVPVRSEEEIAIPKDTEVVVIRYEKGVAYVRRWDDLAEWSGGSDLLRRDR